METRTQVAVVAGKIARAATRRGGHGGTALPGLIAEKIDPAIVRRLGAQLDRSALITGTNGKTTTARMLAGILAADGRRVVHNRAGSNLMRGLASTLIEAARADGRLPNAAAGVFEVDEATLPAATAATRPSVLVIGNLLRDQLDRYGEVDAVRDQWLRTIRDLPAATALALNADDPSVATLADEARGRVVLFGVDDPLPSVSDHAAEARWNPTTGADFVYDRVFYAHIGHWRCADGSLQRPTPQVRATAVDRDAADGVAFDLSAEGRTARVRLPLRGLYNVYNALAAAAAAQVLGVDLDVAAEALNHTRAVFGRQERLVVEGRPVWLLLGKNPAGLNEALRTLHTPGARHHLLVLLNDRLADGTDISWIWDTDWEALTPYVQSVVVGGARAADMALRLQYAGFPGADAPVERDIEAALQRALQTLPRDAELTVLPTYTAMLEVRERLGRRAGVPPIWEGA